jgi:hypothetical protein
MRPLFLCPAFDGIAAVWQTSHVFLHRAFSLAVVIGFACAMHSIPGAFAQDAKRTGKNSVRPTDQKSPEKATAELAADPNSPPVDSAQPTEDEKAEKEKAEKDEVVAEVKSNSSLQVIAKDLKLNEVRAQRLRRIADRYFRETRVRLVITGGSRTSEKQAQLMYAKFKRGDDVDSLYENQAALREIKSAFLLGRKARKPASQVVKMMVTVIDAQVARGEFISKHLQFAAADVRSRGMKSTHLVAFRAAVAAESGVTLVDERDAAEPHLHLSL